MLVVCDAVEGAFYSNHLLPLCVVRNRASINHEILKGWCTADMDSKV